MYISTFTFRRTALLLILLGCVFAAGSASVLRSIGANVALIKHAEQVLGDSIFLHAIIAVSLGLVAQLTSLKAWRSLPLGLTTSILPILFLVTLDESLQHFIPTRNFAWLDMVVNVVGVLTGALCVALLQHLIRIGKQRLVLDHSSS
ncbi:VanZ family protein [Vibrio ulleungensis]|uniref:VanZ family protein n=1 Tax=Vibrio ulleungensis TaxID=2807619 RepID=A0ABS2HHE5_9VIBR|nr:VanZ family protein [Vibrio ulleungensis]MBM7036965.1 VanZ family protein [Vibrio ulleungensis]